MRRVSIFFACSLMFMLTYAAQPSWAITDPDCDGNPYRNTPAIHNFAVQTASDQAYAASSLTGSFLACGSDLTGAPKDYKSLYKYFNIFPPADVEVNAKAVPDGSYAGKAQVNFMVSISGSDAIFRDVDVTLRVDTDPGTDCPGQAIQCLRGDTDPGGWGQPRGHNWNWVTQDQAGRYVFTIGPIHIDGGGRDDRAGFTRVKFRLCERYGSQARETCGAYGDPWVLKNGSSVVILPSRSLSRPYGPGFSMEAWGTFTITGTQLHGTRVGPERSNFVRWVDDRR